MQIFVKGFAGIHYSIEVESSDTVDSLKAKVEELEGVPAKEQRLIFAGRQLEDGHKLSDYNVVEFSSLLEPCHASSFLSSVSILY